VNDLAKERRCLGEQCEDCEWDGAVVGGQAVPQRQVGGVHEEDGQLKERAGPFGNGPSTCARHIPLHGLAQALAEGHGKPATIIISK
jgi:hypothetical protein